MTRSGVTSRTEERGAGPASCLLAAPLGERFTPKRLLGCGGMGVVVSVFDHTLGRGVAVKTLPRTRANDPVARQRLREEAELHRRAGVVGVVPLLDVCETPSGVPCLVLEPIEGPTLRMAAGRAREMRDDPRHSARVLGWLAEVGETLARLHARGLLHLDVKPDNVLVGADGHAWVIDLGLARPPRHASNDERSGACGTPPYTPMEVFFGPAIDARTDQFSLALTALEVLTGEVPWHIDEHTESAFVLSALNEPAPRLAQTRPDLGSALDAALARASSQQIEDRLDHITELTDALRAAATTSIRRAA